MSNEAQSPPPPVMSPDGRFYFDGSEWLPYPDLVPTQAPSAPTKAGPPIGAAILGGFFGLLFGGGLGLYLQEALILSPFSKADLLLPAGGTLMGILVGVFGGRRPKS